MKTMKFLLAALLVCLATVAQSATYYGFKIGGISVTSDNFNNVRSDHMSALNQNVNGGDYLVTYNPDTKIVVLYNVNIERTGSGNRAILNESCEGLTVVLRRGNHLEARDASPVRLETSTTIIGDEVDGYKFATIKGGSEGGMTIANGATVTIRNIDLDVYADHSYCINGVANSSTNPNDWATLIIENCKFRAETDMVSNNWAICNLKHLTVNNSFVNIYGWEAIHNLQSFTKGPKMCTMDGGSQRVYFYAPDMNFSFTPDATSPTNVIRIQMKMSDETGIAIDETNFPDPKFRAVILNDYDDNGDDLLSEREINQTKRITIKSGKGVTNMKGLEYFTLLEKLECSGNELTSLDLSPFIQLRYLTCNNCGLTSLDVSHNPFIIEIWCQSNNLTTLDLSANDMLTHVDFADNHIRGAGMDSLVYSLNRWFVAHFYDAGLRVKLSKDSDTENEMTQEQVLLAKSKGWTSYYWGVAEGATKYSWIEYEGVISSTPPGIVIDAEHFPDAAFRAEVASDVVDLDQNGVLSEYELRRRSVLNVHGKNIASLQGIEHFTELQRLNCYDNNLRELDLSHSSGIRQVYLYGNNICGEAMDRLIASLPSRPSSELGFLYVVCDGRSPDNTMTNLQVAAAIEKGWKAMKSADNGEMWTPYSGEDVGFLIDEQHFPDEKLRTLIQDETIDRNKDGYLSVWEREQVLRMNYEGEGIKSAKGIEYFPNLTWLYLGNNELEELDLHRNQQLEEVSCSNNKLTSWSFSYQQNRSLKRLYCYDNQFTQLDFSNNPALIKLMIYGNNIRGEAMTVLVNSLPECQYGEFTVYNDEPDEGNYITYSQMVTVREKGWKIYDRHSYTGTDVPIEPSSLGVGIDEYNFPDIVFRDYVKQFDTNPDGALSEEELSAVTTMNAIGNVADLTGIENFTALKRLEVQNQQLTKLDVSKLTELETLWCDGNQLNKLDLTNNTKLIHLQCTNNQLTELDLANNTTLVDLGCENNLLNQLDVANNTALVTLSCSNNQLKSLNVAQNEALIDLRCDHNQLTTLDLSTNVNLEYIECRDNQLTSILTAPGTPKISMNCWNNHLKGRTMTDVVNHLPTVESGAIYFRSLDDIEDNEMTSAQVNIATGKGWKIWQDWYYDRYTDYWGNDVTLAINETNFPDTNFRNFVRGSNIDKDGDGYLSDEEQQAVKTIDVSGCYISDLTGIQYFTNLEELNCSYNQIESLNLQQNTKLKILNCSNNQLTRLVQGNEGLEEVNCSNNQIAELMLYASTLRSVDCYNNKLTSYTSYFLADLPDLSSLPEDQRGELYFRCDFGDVNEITTQLVQFAKQRGWTVYATTGNHWYEYEGSHIKGDANGDGVVNIADAIAVVNYILNDGTVTGNFYFNAADMNNDYLITIADVVAIVGMCID